METMHNFINGEFLPAKSGKVIPSIAPSLGKDFGTLPDSDSEDIALAVRAAQKAFPVWSKMPADARSKLLYKLADLIDSNLDVLANAESLDQGKTVALAKAVDIPRAAYNFRFFAGAILHHEDMSTVMGDGSVNYVLSQPIGVAGLISPWNLPLYLLTWKIAPAICVGNTVVCKPSELTSYTAFKFASLIKQSGIPDGVINIVFGTGPKAGQALVEHPHVPLISFTGGTVTGKKIAITCASLLKKLSLELGGKNPNIIFNDCNLDKYLPTIVNASFLNQGEICLCGERVFVQEGIYDTFLEKFKEATKKLKVGDPKDPSTNVGALVSEQHLEKVMYYISIAKDLGGTIEVGGEREPVPNYKDGYFFQPTIITGLPNESRICQEEIFGPVVNIIPFKTEEDAIKMANNIEYGLSATVFTENLGQAQRVSAALETGTVWVNCWMNRDLRVPFGGAKMSGIGREGGKFSLEFFTERKTVCLKST